MKLYIPTDLTTSTLVSSSVAGSTYDEYNSGTTYSTGNNVKVSFESDGTTPIFPVVEYQSLADANTGNYPPDDASNWIEVGAENRGKMFDDYVNTLTEDTDDITIILNANSVDAVFLGGLVGLEVTLTSKRNGVQTKTETIDLRTLIPSTEVGWYSWLYEPFEYGISQLVWEFPRYVANNTIEITVTDKTGEAAIGMVALLNKRDLGTTEYSPTIGITDYSVKSTDSLGRTYLAQGSYAKRANITMHLMNTRIDYIARQLTEVRGQAAVFQMNERLTDHETLLIYGVFESFDITIPGSVVSKCNLEVEGLI